jgi:DNA-binding PadR family transcriptional regulator
MSKRTTGLLPQVSFSILFALSLRARHGYELMKQVEEDSVGKVKLGPGALYGAIKQLNEDGLIEELATDGGRRRYYRLTKRGHAKLGSEMEYFENTVRLAQTRQLLGSEQSVML